MPNRFELVDEVQPDAITVSLAQRPDGQWARVHCPVSALPTLPKDLTSGDMAIAAVVASLSPSMDIQVASNFERLWFELKGRNGGVVAADLRQFRETGRLPPDTPTLNTPWRASPAFCDWITYARSAGASAPTSGKA